MGVISALELVLDQHPASCCHIARKNVGTERFNRLFDRLKLKHHPHCIGQQREVFGKR